MAKKNKMNYKKLISELHTHRRAYATVFGAMATLSGMYAHPEVAMLLSAVSASFATWSLVLPKRK